MLKTYLDFLQTLNIPFTLKEIIDINHFPINLELNGWQGVIDCTCLSLSNQRIEIDIRYAWGEEIWQQSLFDFAWSEARLLKKRPTISSKLIIYLCEPETGILEASKLEFVPKKYLIAPYWDKLAHLYLALPLSHPLGNLKRPQEYVTGYGTTKNKKPVTIKPSIQANNAPTLINNSILTNYQKEGGLRTQGLYKQDFPDKPLISVITVVYNGEKYLEQTIQSIINQTYDNVEYIIVDGGSTDKTLDIIQQYNEQIDYWISEPDQGIYDAMNKANKLAFGRYTLHINADDLLFQANSLSLNYSNYNLAGLVLIFHPEEQIIKKRLHRKTDPNEYLNLILYPFHHQGFIGIRNHNSLFDSSYKIIADNLLIAKKIKTEEIILLNSIITIHRREGISAENNNAINQELLQAITSNNSIRVMWTIYTKIFYSKLRSIAKALKLVTLKRKYL